MAEAGKEQDDHKTSYCSRSMFIKNCEGLESLLYLQINRLACHSFTDAHRRQETQASGIKNFLGSGTARSFMFVSVLLPLNPCGAQHRAHAHAVNQAWLRRPELRDPVHRHYFQEACSKPPSLA